MPLAGTNMNLFSNSLLMKAMAQESGYGYESSDGKKDRSYYSTDDDYKYECQTGSFKGFYVGSADFCDPKKFHDDKPIVLNTEKVVCV